MEDRVAGSSVLRLRDLLRVFDPHFRIFDTGSNECEANLLQRAMKVAGPLRDLNEALCFSCNLSRVMKMASYKRTMNYKKSDMYHIYNSK
jgi:hypothetical protein